MSDEMIETLFGVGVAVQTLQFQQLIVGTAEGILHGSSRRLEGLHLRGFRSNVINHLRLGC